jgi:CDP-diacylglycerol--serine O-phosphatidyltransferase
MRIEKPEGKPQLRLIQLLPNLMTIAAICFGVTAIRFAMETNYEMAVKLILLAAVLDALDGRVARLLRSESAFGAELDSLADFVNFGVAPALILYFWGLQDIGGVGWIAALTFAICGGLRLARFNVANKAAGPAADRRFFVGVPAPAGAFLAFLPMFVAFSLSDPDVIPAPVVGAQLVGVGLLMISRLPTPAFKAVTIYRENLKFYFVGFGVAVAAALTHLWLMLAACGVAYLAVLASILWSRRKTWRSWRS